MREIGRLFLAFSLIVAFAPVTAGAQPLPAGSRTLVMPFDNVNREARIYWLGEASAVLLTDDLNVLGANAISRNERVRVFEELHLPAVPSVTEATIIRAAQIAGATQVVMGTLDLAGDTLTVRARQIRLDTGRLQEEVLERGPLPDLFAVFERLARRLRSGTTAAVQPGALDPTLPPLGAFEQYIKGLLADTPATQIKFLDQALKMHPSYDRAHLALWEAYTGQGEHAKALASLSGVTESSRVHRAARFLAGLSQLELKRYDEAYNTLKTLLDADPTATLFNNLGVIQVRRGWTAQSGRPEYFFNQAAQSEPNEPDYYFNLGYAYWLERDLPAAIYWLREAVRRDPTDGDAHFVLGAALQARGTTVEAAREKELARQLSSTYAEWERKSTAAGETVPRGLERVKNSLESRRAERVDAAVVDTAQREQRELAAFHLDRGRRLFEQERDFEAIVELRRTIYLSPYQAEPHLLLGRIHLRRGQVTEAVDALKISLWSEETVAARLALGEAYLQAKDPTAARAEAQRALTLDPASADAKRLLARTDQATNK